MGRFRKAREIVERLRTIVPVVVANASYLRKPEDREPYLPGLRWRRARGMSQTRRLAAIPAADVAGYTVRCGLYPPAQPTCRSRRRSRTYPSQSDGC